MEKTIIRHGKWSVCYKQGDKFIKKYIYGDISAIQREALASRTAMNFGLLTPRYIDSYTIAGKTNSVFEYCDMQMIDEDSICSPFYIKQILNILALLARIPWDGGDTYWHKQLNDFYDALNHIDDKTNYLVDFLKELTPTIFIHGDFTCDNLGVSSQNIIVYDFQHGSLGPIGWDKAYLASTLAPKFSGILGLNEIEKRMALTISAIRYGRGIRKFSVDMEKRQTLYSLWKESIKW